MVYGFIKSKKELMKQLITLIIVLSFSLTGFSQTVYLLDSSHNQTLGFSGWDNSHNKSYDYDIYFLFLY